MNHSYLRAGAGHAHRPPRTNR